MSIRALEGCMFELISKGHKRTPHGDTEVVKGFSIASTHARLCSRATCLTSCS